MCIPDSNQICDLMMKNLKHFFGSSGVKASDIDDPQESVVEPAEKRRRKTKNVEVIDVDDDSLSQPPKKKSKKRKSKVDQNGEVSCEKVKPNKHQNKRKTTDNVDSLIQNVDKIDEVVVVEDNFEVQTVSSKKKKRRVSPEMSPDEIDSPTYSPPTANNSLLNYFTKVDKSELSTPKFDKPTVLKVKAVVHDPPLTDPGEKRKRSPKFEEIKMKLRLSLGGDRDQKKRKFHRQEDFDLIICESIEEPLLEQSGSKIVVEPVKSHPVVDLVDEETNYTKLGTKATKPAVKIKHDGTLASFFTIGNRVPKPMFVLTEEQKQAKQNFLQSGSPANIKKIVTSSGSNQPTGSAAPLPIVSHVQQKDLMHIIWNLPPVELNLKPKNCDVVLPKWSSLSCSTNGAWESQPQPQPAFDQKKELKQLKRDSDHPITNWFKYLREMNEMKVGQMWSEKYKPSSITHLNLARPNDVEKFQTWLTNLRNCTKRDDKEAYDSMDDFIVDDESKESTVQRRRAALLTGPSGIGKTAIVYAVANELGYEVLELNASSNRSGKRILSDFSEALQSHKVEANAITELVGKRNKKKKKKAPSLPTKSLILIEDADLLFADNDDGFLTTAATLAASSKRPVVFIANERGCKHLLSKISPHLEIDIHFSDLKHDRISSWLRTVCIVENLSIEPFEIDQLVSSARKCDIRKCLLQLEFLSKGNRQLNSAPKPDSRSSRHVWNRLGEMKFSSKNDRLRNYFRLLTLTDVLLVSTKTQVKDDNPCRRPWESTERDSTELICSNDSTCLLTEELVQYNLSLLNDLCDDDSSYNQTESIRNERISEMEESLISPAYILSRTAVSLDYAPALRWIARSERDRFALQSKRNNRYFHYLRPDDTKSIHKMNYDLLSQPFNPPDSAHAIEDTST